MFVPPTTKPGFYSGDINVTAQGGQATRRTLLVRVLPLRLPPVQKGYGFWWTTDDRWRGYYSEKTDEALDQTRKQFVMLRERGCNLISIFAVPQMTRGSDGRVSFDFTRSSFDNPLSMSDVFRVGRDTGLFSPDVPLQYAGADLLRQYGAGSLALDRNTKEFDTLYRDACRRINEWAKSEGFTLAFACVDEIGNSEDRRGEALRFYRLAKDAGVLTSVTDNSPETGLHCTAQSRFADIITMRLFNFLTPEIIEQTRESGGSLWLYNLGSGGWDAHRDRFVFGLFTESSGARGHVQWALQWASENVSPYDAAVSGKRSGWHYALPSPDGPLPTLALEGVRAGIDDGRYLSLVRRTDGQQRSADLADIEPFSPHIDELLERCSDSNLSQRRWRWAREAMK